MKMISGISQDILNFKNFFASLNFMDTAVSYIPSNTVINSLLDVVIFTRHISLLKKQTY